MTVCRRGDQSLPPTSSRRLSEVDPYDDQLIFKFCRYLEARPSDGQRIKELFQSLPTHSSALDSGGGLFSLSFSGKLEDMSIAGHLHHGIGGRPIVHDGREMLGGRASWPSGFRIHPSVEIA